MPVFVDGQAQPVFPTGSANWINHELWVETTVDSDFDGKLDRIHVDVSRVRETDTDGLKVPVVMEVSPYYGGSVNVVNWAVDHEIGFPPATRVVRAPNVTNTSPQISTAHEATWVPRGFADPRTDGPATRGRQTRGGRLIERGGGRAALCRARRPSRVTSRSSSSVCICGIAPNSRSWSIEAPPSTHSRPAGVESGPITGRGCGHC